MQLNPQEFFTIARGLEDHTDNTVFYVRATVRNALTDALLATVNLTNQGDNHRYSVSYQVPADPSGSGLYIIITTSVYSDSAYTTKSPLYGDKYDTYLVMQRVNPNLGNGGSDVDYKRIGKMIEEIVGRAIKAIPAPESIDLPEMPKVDLSPVIEQLSYLKECTNKMEAMMQKPADFKEILSKIDALAIQTKNLEISEEHLQPLKDLQSELTGEVDERSAELKDTAEEINAILAKIKEFFSGDMEKILSGIGDIQQKFDGINHIVLNGKQNP